MTQIKDGKHMYRCLEAHMTLYLTLYQKYLQRFIDSNIEIEKDLREAITSAVFNLKDYKTQEQDMLQRNNKNLLERMQNAKFHLLQKEFDRKMENQARYYRNYMAAFEILLLFIRASRQQSWELHLKALNEMVPYFFPFDMLNYARLTPVYLPQMIQLKEKDNDT